MVLNVCAWLTHHEGIQRVTNSFNPKTMCDGRKYKYLIPSFALQKQKNIPTVWKDDETFDINKLDLKTKISKEQVDKVNSLFAKYVGTKCFKNYTQRGNRFADKNLMYFNRYITECRVEQPIEIGGMECLVVCISGQSFMLHQIRKMIGIK